jgi:protein TonB
VGIIVAAIPAKKVMETYQVMVSDRRRKPEPPKAAANPAPQERKPVAKPMRAARAVAQASVAKTASETPGAAAESTGFVPNLGLVLDNAGPNDGIAVPVASRRLSEPSVTPPIKKSLVTRSQGSRSSACAETMTKAKVTQLRRPRYSEAAQSAGVTGKVRLRVSIDESGRVTDVRVVEGLGFGLDEAALAAARETLFAPATHCGRRVASTFNLAVRFGV